MCEIKVYISSDINISTVSKKQLSNLYLKKTDNINGEKLIPLNTVEDYEEFCRKILNKSPSQIHAYWMKQVFLGKKIPPKSYVREKISQMMKNSKNTIAYSSQEEEGRSIYEVK